MHYIRYYWCLYIYCTTAGIFSLYLFVHKQCEYIKLWVLQDKDVSLVDQYDFIVVGGGSAGSLAAGRLAENSHFKVLLVEAGGSSSVIHDIPLSSPIMQMSPYDWQYKTVPQEDACWGLSHQKSNWPMGKILGGTSRLNYMIYLRGHEADFKSWTNNEDWTISDVLYYFKKSENHIGKFKSNRVHHGVGGPVYVSDLMYETGLGEAVLEGLGEIGIPSVDLNTLSTSAGAMKTQVMSFAGARWSMEHALNSLYTPRLSILTNTVVNKVLLRNGFEAYGIEYNDSFGKRREIKARHGVILSAGTIGSARLLMLSGIGRYQHLNNLSIEHYIDLPVGENLQDHVTTGLDLVMLNKTLISAFNPLVPVQYILNGEGVLSHPGCEALCLIDSSNKGQPDLQLMVLPAGITSDFGSVLKKAMAISDKVWNDYFLKLVGKPVATILPTILHPKSRGYIQLSSSNPETPVVINPKYLSHPDDVAAIVRGLKLIVKLLETEGMKNFGASLNKDHMPGCEMHIFGSDQYWECYVRHLTLTAYHPVGTCSMGSDPKHSVVNHQLEVHGTSKLYVMDASVMPNLPSGNTQASVMMIAEKGVDLLKKKIATRFTTCKNTFLSFTNVTLIHPRVNAELH